MRMRPFLRRLSQELEAEGRDQRAQHRGSAARDLSEQRPSRSAMDGDPRVHLPANAARCTRSRRPRRAIRSCMISSPTSKASIATGWASRCRQLRTGCEWRHIDAASHARDHHRRPDRAGASRSPHAWRAQGANVAVGSYRRRDRRPAAAMPPPIPTRPRSRTFARRLQRMARRYSPAISMCAKPTSINGFPRAGASGLRPGRHLGQCRRHDRRAAGLRPFRRTLAEDHRHQSQRRVPHDARACCRA